jgi:hypothetical protein
MVRVLYEARGVHQLPKRVSGPLREYSIGLYFNRDDAALCVSWWCDLRGGMHGWRGEAYVVELVGVSVQAASQEVGHA